MKILIPLALLLSACATPRGPDIESATPAGVVVDWANSTQGDRGAMELAEAHCQQFGKHARFSGKPNVFKLAYDCL